MLRVPELPLDPDLPVLDLLDDAPVPLATAPILVTSGGQPLGFVPADESDPRGWAERAFVPDPDVPGWQDLLGDRRPAATVVVATTGERSGPLNVLLRSLLTQSYVPLEVAVVDNRPGSWDHGELLHDRRVRVVEQPVRGVSAARNAGLAASTTPVVLYLDDDVVPSPDWAGWLVAALHTTPETACATGLILPLDTRTEGQRLLEEWGGFGKGLERRLHQHPHPAPPSVLYPYQPGAFGSGASVGFWASELRALGGYDEVLGAGTPAHGGEDLAVQLSVVLSGRHLAYEPCAVVWHRHRASRQEWTRQLFWYGVGLSATMLRCALTSPRDFAAVLRRVPAAARHAFAHDSARNAHRSADYPRSLVLVELLGMLAGPIALGRSWAGRHRR
ncbi:MAG: glycosyl transferase family 2 [Frankiales bacterium]|nr:glycosyl transferase family 2 [Frankiales bacterium]